MSSKAARELAKLEAAEAAAKDDDAKAQAKAKERRGSRSLGRRPSRDDGSAYMARTNSSGKVCAALRPSGSAQRRDSRSCSLRLCMPLLWQFKSMSGSTYTGAINAQRHRDGHGHEEYSVGGRYVGEFLMDKRHGEGEMHFATGAYYRGEWTMDQQNGHGEYHYDHGARTPGFFPARMCTHVHACCARSLARSR